MENEALKILFAREAFFNNIELKERDLYLRQLALGNFVGPVTGYPHIDKPWLKYYTEEALTSTLPNMSMYDSLCENNKGNFHNVAINYLDKKYTYEELFIIQ